MTKYSNTAKKPDQYLKGLREHWRLRRKGSDRDKRNAAINDCWLPSLGASKADLAEFHQEEMKLRRRRQLAATATVSSRRLSKSDDPAYRKSIWPAEKIARRSA